MRAIRTSRAWQAAFPAIVSAAMVCASLAPVSPLRAGQSGTARDREPGRIRVEVNLVNVLVSVLDSNNRPVPDLPREAFAVSEENVAQKIEVFEKETQQPLDLVLMIDASLSTLNEMVLERETAGHFIRQVLRPSDRLSVYEFTEDVTQLSGFSDNVAMLEGALRRIAEGAGTSLYDAVYTGARALERRSLDRRRVIVMVTDAGETTSHLDFDSARREAIRSGALLYTIVIRPVKNESGRNTAGEHAIQTITDATGGAMFFPDSAQELGSIFDRIERELRTQYRLGYYPNPRGPAGSFRRVEVLVKGEYQVRHRTGYFMAEEAKK
jgi:Ca-activated chloride channel homolog